MTNAATARDLFGFDLDHCGGSELAGADEAGRGCLAGPLVAAAVVFDYSRGATRFECLEGRLDDSKKLSAARREELAPLIIGAASRFSIVSATNLTIDRDGLHRTNLRLLGQSLLALDPCSSLALVDGYEIPGFPSEHLSLKKGDEKSACIAAASVLAKVFRDRMMSHMHEIFPQYGFDHHVGYGTAAHKEAIKRHGFCRLHRRSFRIGSLRGSEGTG